MNITFANYIREYGKNNYFQFENIIDNSIQWKTENNIDINIILIEKDGHLEDIFIIDNGKGMSNENLENCLGRINSSKPKTFPSSIDTSNLLYSCFSLTKDYHVFSWQWKKNIRYKWRIHNEDNESFNEVFPFESLNSFPPIFTNYLPELSSYNSGTIIYLKNCDRLLYKRAKTIKNKLEAELGRIYRNFFGNGVSIKIKAFNQTKDNNLILIDDHCEELRIFDPLFLKINTYAPYPYNSTPSSEPFGNEVIVKFIDDNKIKHQIKIRGSIVKKEIQLADLSKEDNRKLSKLYNSVHPISLVRANKEIDSGNFGFFPFLTTDFNYRWWKIEIQFDPISDTLMGVGRTNQKTDFRYYSEDDYDDFHINRKLIFALSMEVNKLTLEMKKVIEGRKKDSLNN